MTEKTPYAPDLKSIASANIVRATDVFADHFGMSRISVSRMAVNDNTFIPRVSAGDNFTVAMHDRVLAFLSAMWPDDGPAWPGDVPRPVPRSLPPEVERPARRQMAAARERKLKQQSKETTSGRAA